MLRLEFFGFFTGIRAIVLKVDENGQPPPAPEL
jgi:hypothetical protein